MNKIAFILFNIIVFVSCAEKRKLQDDCVISVSIAPLAYLTDRITDGDFEINILVPAGSSPETYELTATQMKKVSNSKFFINTTLIDFEKNLNRTIADISPDVKIVDVSVGIDLIEEEEHHHHHGTDPHIWTTPNSMKIIAANIFAEISNLYPDSVKYIENYNSLLQNLNQLDTVLVRIFESGQNNFLIYHPALSYLARDYGLEQIAVEYEGKEPSVDYIKSLINQAKVLNINKILYQIEFSKSTVDALSRELGIEAVVINPLAYDITDNILKISQLISE